MAAGEVFSNVNIPLTSDGTTIRPAINVEIMLSGVFGTSDQPIFQTINATGTSANMFSGSVSGATAEARYMGLNIKLFFTNTEYFRFVVNPGQTGVIGYTGMQLK